MSTAAPRRARLDRWLHRARPGATITRRRLGIAAAVLALLFGAWLWLRSSSLVAVRRVQVVGLSGPDVTAIRAALTHAARMMTTLNVDDGALARSVSAYPFVVGVHTATHLPHGLTVIVQEEVPVASVRSNGRWTAVDAAGRLLAGDAATDLPRLDGAPDTGGNRVSAPGARAILTVLAAAPYPLLAHLEGARTTARHGIVIQLRDGPRLDFGDAAAADRKWSDVDAVLADPTSAGASYIDVSAPSRPAAGAGGGG